MIKVLHVITTLGRPGRNHALPSRFWDDSSGFENELSHLPACLDLAERRQEVGVRVRTLGMKTNVLTLCW